MPKQARFMVTILSPRYQDKTFIDEEISATVEIGDDITINELMVKLGINFHHYQVQADANQRLSAIADIGGNVNLTINKKISGDSASGHPLKNINEQQRLIDKINTSKADVFLFNIGSYSKYPDEKYQENPEFIQQLKKTTKAVEIYNIDPLYFFNPSENNFETALDSSTLTSQELLTAIQQKLKNNAKVIIFDNTHRTFTEFTSALGKNNRQYIHKNLEIISGYGMGNARYIPVIKCGEPLFNNPDPAAALENYSKSYVNNGQGLLGDENKGYKIDDTDFMQRLKTSLHDKTGSQLFASPMDIKSTDLFRQAIPKKSNKVTANKNSFFSPATPILNSRVNNNITEPNISHPSNIMSLSGKMNSVSLMTAAETWGKDNKDGFKFIPCGDGNSAVIEKDNKRLLHINNNTLTHLSHSDDAHHSAITILEFAQPTVIEIQGGTNDEQLNVLKKLALSAKLENTVVNLTDPSGNTFMLDTKGELSLQSYLDKITQNSLLNQRAFSKT